jgi:hypothetical protein
MHKIASIKGEQLTKPCQFVAEKFNNPSFSDILGDRSSHKGAECDVHQPDQACSLFSEA